jgi:hypothetical protein
MQVADALRDALRERDRLLAQVQTLEAQLRCAQAFHDVAVRERNLAWAQLDLLKARHGT